MRYATLAVGAVIGIATLSLSSFANAQTAAPPPVAPAQPAAAAAQPAPATGARPVDKDEDKDKETGPARSAENAVFLEIGGNGLIYSVNYEHLFGDSDFSLRGGFSYLSLGASGGGASAKATFMTFPILANYYIGGKNNKLEIGAGATMVYAATSAGTSTSFASVSGLVPAPTMAVGYRYIPAKGGFTFFIGFTPLILPGADRPIWPWAGTSFGGVF
jgi:hypothetical protein